MRNLEECEPIGDDPHPQAWAPFFSKKGKGTDNKASRLMELKWPPFPSRRSKHTAAVCPLSENSDQ
jgi:hypothetical protein